MSARAKESTLARLRVDIFGHTEPMNLHDTSGNIVIEFLPLNFFLSFWNWNIRCLRVFSSTEYVEVFEVVHVVNVVSMKKRMAQRE